jgi:hypothetical protein
MRLLSAISLLSLAGVVGLAGCGGKTTGGDTPRPGGQTPPGEGGAAVDPKDPDVLNLKVLGLVYLTYVDAKKAPPAKVEDVERFLERGDKALAGLKAGTYVMVWNVPPPPKGGKSVIVAYQKDVPTKGGLVAKSGPPGEVVRMTAAEFQAAMKEQ